MAASRTAAVRWPDRLALEARRGVAWTRAHATLQMAAWGLPLLVFLFVRHETADRLTKPIGLIVAVGLLALVIRAPSRALALLVGLLPFQLIALAFLYKLGVPKPVLRPLASWRDLVVIGLGLAAVRNIRKERHRLDTLDKVAIAFLAYVTLYLAVPTLFVRPPSATSYGAPKDLTTRLLAFRIDIGFIVAFLAARHATFKPDTAKRVLRAALIAGLLVASTVMWEFFASSSWNRFGLNTIGLPAYQQQVLNVTPPNAKDIRHYIVIGGHKLVRPGGLLFDPLEAGFYLLIPLGIGIESLSRRRTGASYLIAIPAAVATIFTNVRSAALGAIVIAVLALRPQGGRTTASRMRVALLLAAALTLVIPVAIGTGLSTRTSTAAKGTDPSAQEHRESFSNGVASLFADPLGRGLGTQPGVGDRFQVPGILVSENGYLQFGDELGIPALLLFVSFLFLLYRRARVAADADPDSVLATSLPSITLGLAVTTFFLHVWTHLDVTVTLCVLGGLVIGLVERREREQTDPYRAATYLAR